MRSKFDEQLSELNQQMIEMGNKIVSNIKMAIEALVSRDVDKARAIMESDEEIDHLQKVIEGICFNLLIQQQPVARDLRTVTAAMKMVTDMERIGDQAADIAELTIMMAYSPYLLNVEHIKKMSAETVMMLMQAVQAYVERDMKKAQEVIEHDDIVDELFVKVKTDLIEVMRNNADYAEHAADLLMVNKYLERIGDHATNIAEWVIFSIDDHVNEKA